MSGAKSTGWRDLIQVHPAAELFPVMAREELRELGEDIKANGLTARVTTWVDKDGTEWLLDGRNRLDALAIAGYRFKLHARMRSDRSCDPERFQILSPDGKMRSYVSHCYGSDFDPYAFVASANIHRRHLTQDQKRELIGKLLKAYPERSDRATAVIANSSRRRSPRFGRTSKQLLRLSS